MSEETEGISNSSRQLQWVESNGQLLDYRWGEYTVNYDDVRGGKRMTDWMMITVEMGKLGKERNH